MFKNTNKKFLKGTVAPVQLLASAFIALIAIFGVSTIPLNRITVSEMRIEPLDAVVEVNKSFDIEIVVDSKTPVNVFAGELRFDPTVLRIKLIDYNTSIADLWAELPWYSNGEGTLTFGGGTTKTGGFKGIDTLIRVTFETINTGKGVISINNPRILLHDGLGTDVELAATNDAIFTITNTQANVPAGTQRNQITSYRVAKEVPNTDLNGDGEQNLVDISIFMLNMAGYDPRYDFNLDGEVGLKDLNILLSK